MEYLLSQKELDALTPVKGLQDRNEALEIAREIIIKVSGFPCGQTYCSDCPVYKFGKDNAGHSKKAIHRYLCIRLKSFPK